MILAIQWLHFVQNRSNSIICLYDIRQYSSPCPQRRERLRQMLREGGVARVEDLRKSLDVSVATIRRDLEILEEQGQNSPGTRGCGFDGESSGGTCI